MSKLHQLLASTAMGLGIALTATSASAVDPIINGNFKQLSIPTDYKTVVGWTSKAYENPPKPYGAGFPATGIFQSNVVSGTIGPDLPVTHYGRFDCGYNCKYDRTITLSQTITGLEQGKKYTVTFWVLGWSDGWTHATGYVHQPIPPFGVSLGSQSAEPILLPAPTMSAWGTSIDPPWSKKSVTFTYTDPGTSAPLTFTQHMSGSYIPSTEVPLDMIIQTRDVILLSLEGGGIAEEITPGPKLTVKKALDGSRATNTDQFTVQILNGSTVVNATTNSTTKGSGSTVDSGTGTTGQTTLTAGTSYTIKEVGSGTTTLGRYSSTLSCANSTGTTVPTALNTAFTLASTDTVSCTITNKIRPALLTVRQLVQAPLPVNIVAPFSFNWTGDNGWATQKVTNLATGTIVNSTAQTLTAFNTATSIAVTLPTTRWNVSSIKCLDANAAVSGNSSGNLVEVLKSTTATLPASVVRPGANLRCTGSLWHTTP